MFHKGIPWLWGRILVGKKAKGKQYHIPFINAAGKNIKWGRGEGNGNFWEKNQDFKRKGGGEEYNVRGKGTLYTPGPPCRDPAPTLCVCVDPKHVSAEPWERGRVHRPRRVRHRYLQAPVTLKDIVSLAVFDLFMFGNFERLFLILA